MLTLTPGELDPNDCTKDAVIVTFAKFKIFYFYSVREDESFHMRIRGFNRDGLL